MGALAFFPWLEIEKVIAVGDFELWPYERGQQFVPDPAATPVIESVTAGYWDRHDLRSDGLTVLTTPARRALLANVTDDEITELYEFADLLAFAGLAHRRYFWHDGYWNRDHFRLVVQKFVEPGDGAALRSRRRDGGTTNFIPEEYFRVLRPEHVRNAAVSVDEPLLGALLAAVRANSAAEMVDGVLTFNLANTDAPYMSPHVELILTANAFQRTLDCRTTKDEELGGKFLHAFKPSGAVPLSSGRLASAVPKFSGSSTVREVWIRDLYRVRGALGHGKVATQYPSVWTIMEHLLLGAFAFPLLAKQLLASDGRYVMTEQDLTDVEALEHLAVHPELMKWKPAGGCTWTKVISDVRRERAIQRDPPPLSWTPRNARRCALLRMRSDAIQRPTRACRSAG